MFVILEHARVVGVNGLVSHDGDGRDKLKVTGQLVADTTTELKYIKIRMTRNGTQIC